MSSNLQSWVDAVNNVCRRLDTIKDSVWAIHETETCWITQIKATEATYQHAALSVILVDLKKGSVGNKKIESVIACDFSVDLTFNNNALCVYYEKYGAPEVFKASSLQNAGGDLKFHPQHHFKRTDSNIDIKRQLDLARCILGTKQRLDSTTSSCWVCASYWRIYLCVYCSRGTWRECFGGNAAKRRQYMAQDIPDIAIEYKAEFELALGFFFFPAGPLIP
jgi:hypothetical protein